MTAWRFIKRGIWHYKVSYLGVLAGAVLGATVLLGALLAGDSVKGTLREVAQDRIGQVDSVFAAGEGFFRDRLAADVRRDGIGAAPVLFLKGQLSAQETGRALGGVQIIGVDQSFWSMAPESGITLDLPDREVVVNRHLAASLDLAVGEAVVMRLQEPGKLSRDAPLSGEAEDVISFRAGIRDIVGDDRFGRFSLEATQLPTATVFVPLGRLQEVIGYPAKANMILLNVADPGLEIDVLAEIVRGEMTLVDSTASTWSTSPWQGPPRFARIAFSWRSRWSRRWHSATRGRSGW
ncbi:MAG: hypothetical protein GWO24_22470 [Akkermansiaceae bacterium]|nr:hypothetical protein [Akkermansiaceae bacterium]